MNPKVVENDETIATEYATRKAVRSAVIANGRFLIKYISQVIN